MLLKKSVLISLIFVRIIPSLAQIDDLLKNKDITWVAEISSDFIVDNPELAEKEGLNRIRTIKLLPNSKISGEDDRFEFSYIIQNALEKDEIPFFSDSTFKKRIYAKELTRIDTVVCCFQPCDDGSSFRIIHSFPNPEYFKSFRVLQVVFYNAKQTQFGLRTLAFAPLRDIHDDAGNYLFREPFCWIKVENAYNSPKLSSPDITWARRLSSIKGFDAKTAKVLKQNDDNMPIIHLLTLAETDKTKTFYENNSDKLSFKKLSFQFFHTDTLITYEKNSNSPEFTKFKNQDTVTINNNNSGFPEFSKMKIIEYHLNKSTVKKLRLVQEWYWDEKSQKLSIRLAAVAPLKEVQDDEGNFLYYQPIFYRRTEKD